MRKFSSIYSIILILFISTGSLLFSAGSNESGAGEIEHLKIGTGWDATKAGNYSPHGMWEPAVLIYETLVNLDQDSRPVPCLAKEWHVSQNGMEYTFKLRNGITFHNGKPCNADAVKTNYDKLKNETWSRFKGYIKEVKAIDKTTVVFKLSRPHPLFLTELSFVRHGIIFPDVIVPEDSKKTESQSGMSKMGSKDSGSKMKSGMSGSGTKSGTSGMSSMSGMGKSSSDQTHIISMPIGTGPYKWDEEAYKAKRSFSITRNDNYWQGTPRWARITWEVIPDPGARTIALESGKIHMSGQSTNASLTCENIMNLKKNKKIKIVKAPNWGARLLIVNHTRAPFDTLEFRKALKFAINYDEIQALVGEMAAVCPGPFGPGTPFILSESKLFDFNPNKAKEILDSIGIVDTDGDAIREFNGKNIQIEITGSKNPTLPVLLQQHFKRIGIGVKISPKESGSLFQIHAKMDFDILSYHNIPSYSLDLYDQFSDKGRWALKLNNPAIEKLMLEYKSCTSYEQLKEIGYKIQREFSDSNICLFAINENKVVAYYKELGNFVFPPEEWVGAVQEIWNMK